MMLLFEIIAQMQHWRPRGIHNTFGYITTKQNEYIINNLEAGLEAQQFRLSLVPCKGQETSTLKKNPNPQA